ncbi:MAG TPA: ATP-binding protein [Acidimicrobiales bacterium]|nr:ATP-binding protein [Acidimicrobiales bacterium]
MSHASAGFGADLASVGEARRFVRRALIDMQAEDLEFEACQVVSELATNCVIHAVTPFVVELIYESDVFQIRVSDSSPRSPMTKSHSAQATTGRGLRLVATLADEWGAETWPGGKTVWCTLRSGPARRGMRHLVSIDDDVDDAMEETSASPASRTGLSNLSVFQSTA